MTKQIMIVDDNPDTLKFLRVVFEPRGKTVLTATDGASALDMLSQSKPDIFILDVMMPEINGIELCQRIRLLPEHAQTPVLFLSAWSDAGIVEKTFEAGANDYLLKPFHPQQLADKVDEWLAAAQAEPGEGQLST